MYLFLFSFGLMFQENNFFKEMCLRILIPSRKCVLRDQFLQGNVSWENYRLLPPRKCFIKEHFLKKNELFHQRSKGLGTLEELMKRRRMIGPAVAEAKLVDWHFELTSRSSASVAHLWQPQLGLQKAVAWLWTLILFFKPENKCSVF